MEHVPPPAEELALLDRELARLDARRMQLLTRRAWLLSVLQPLGHDSRGAARTVGPGRVHALVPRGGPRAAAQCAECAADPGRSAADDRGDRIHPGQLGSDGDRRPLGGARSGDGRHAGRACRAAAPRAVVDGRVAGRARAGADGAGCLCVAPGGGAGHRRSRVRLGRFGGAGRSLGCLRSRARQAASAAADGRGERAVHAGAVGLGGRRAGVGLRRGTAADGGAGLCDRPARQGCCGAGDRGRRWLSFRGGRAAGGSGAVAVGRYAAWRR